MKKIIALIICFVLLTSVTCKKDDDCHNEIIIHNDSKDSIIFARRFRNSDGLCVLGGIEIKSGDFYIDKAKLCWEKTITEKNPYDIYIIDPSHFNPNVYYDCDSIENKVLKHYKLSKNEVKERNFLITYP